MDAKTTGNNYIWNTGSNAQKISVSQAGTYSVKVNDSICQSSDTVIVSFDSVVVDLGIDTTICQATTYMLDAQNNGLAFLWSNGSTGQTITVSTSGNYWAKASKNNCFSSDTVAVQFNTNTVYLGNDTTVCKGFSINLDAKNIGSTYAWSTGATSQQITANLAGAYTIAVNDGVCIHYDTLMLSIDSVVVNLGNDTLICGAGGYKLDAGNTGAAYLWSTGGSNQSVNVAANGIYWAKVTDNGCFTYDSILLTFDNPQPKLGKDTLLCPGQTLVLDANNLGSTYQWNDGSSGQILTVTQARTYWVQLKNANGCVAFDTINISYDSLSVNLGNDTVLCLGTWVLDAGNAGNVHYSWNDGTNEQFDTAKATGVYSVMVSNGTCKAYDSINLTFAGVYAIVPADTLTCSDSVFTLSQHTAGVSLSWNTGDTTEYLWVTKTGTYTITVSNGICTERATRNVVFSIPPVADAGSGDTICQGETATLTAQPDGMQKYIWNTKDTLQTISKEPITTTTYQVSVSNGICWSDYDSVEVIVLAKPVATFITDKTGGVVPELIVATNTSQNIVSFLWDFGDGSSNSTDNLVSYNYTDPGKFILSLMVTNAVGCSDTATQLIHILDTFTVFIPNAFSPNGDGLNDFFSINTSGSGEIEGFIVDRWGELIFRYHYPDKLQWDGTFKGVVVQDEIYGYCIWVTDQDNVQHMYTGHIVKISKKK